MDAVKTPTIRELQVRPVRVPMREPHRTASGVITESPLVLVDVMTSEGIEGHAIVFTYTAAALRPTAELLANMGALIKGEPLAPAAVSDKLTSRFRLLGTHGLVGMALAGIDMAMWDALARLHATSLTRLLGGMPKAVPAYGAVGFDGVAGSARSAEEWAGRGVRGIKAKIGYPSVQQDAEVIRSMRDAVGPEMAIMVDYNQCLTPAEAVERLRVLDELGLAWVEEPTLAHDFEGHAQIARESRTPIQCGENWWGLLDLRNAIRAQASDCVMPDVMRIGGVTGWQRAAALAEAYSLRVSNHLWPEISAQLMSVTPTAHWLEYCDWWNRILAEPLQLDDGLTPLKETLGTGVNWDETAVNRYLA